MALLMLGMVLTFVYESFVMSVETKQRVERKAERYQAARIALQRMEMELQSAYLDATQVQNTTAAQGRGGTATAGGTGQIEGAEGTRTIFLGINGDSEGFPRDRVDFTTVAHYIIAAEGDDDRQSDHMEVGYFTETDYRAERTDLMYRNDFTLDDDPGGGGDIYPLLEGIRGLNFRFLDAKNKYWNDTWDSRQQNHVMPAAIEVTLWVDDEDNPKKPLLFSKIVRMPLFAPTLLNEVEPPKDTNGGEGQQDLRGQQLRNMLGAPVNMPDGSRIRVNQQGGNP